MIYLAAIQCITGIVYGLTKKKVYGMVYVVLSASLVLMAGV